MEVVLNCHQVLSLIVTSSLFDSLTSCIRVTVDIYGKDKSKHDVLPIKTDKDTIREGYRCDALELFYFLNLFISYFVVIS